MRPLCHQSEIVVILKPQFFPNRRRFLVLNPRSNEGAFIHKSPRSYPTVDGKNLANQVRLVVYPIIYKVLYIPGRAGFPSTVFCPQNSESSFSQLIPRDFLQGTAGYIPTIAQWHHHLLRVLRADPRLVDLLHYFPFISFKDGNII